VQTGLLNYDLLCFTLGLGLGFVTSHMLTFSNIFAFAGRYELTWVPSSLTCY